MFPTGAFNPISMGFQYPGQQPTAPIYQSQYGGFNPQIPPTFQQIPSARGQSLPASNRQYPPSNGPYVPTSSRRHGQYPPPTSSQHYEYHHQSSKSKKHHKRRSVSPSGKAHESLYSDKEKNDQSPTQSPVLGNHSKSKEEENKNDQEQQSQIVENTAGGETSQGGTIGTEEQKNSEEKRRSRSKKKKHRHPEHYHYQDQFQQQPPPLQPPPLYGELLPQMRVHQQPLYNGYNQAYEESIRRGDIYHKHAKRSTRLPPEIKQQLLPHEDDQQKQYPFSGYSQQPFNNIHPSFNPYQSGFYPSTTPYNIPPQQWSNIGGINNPVEQEIQRLRHHIHTLEGELHKLQKKLNKTTLNNDEIGSPRQTPVIVELNNPIDKTTQKSSSSKKKHRHKKVDHNNNTTQQEQNLVQQSEENNPDQNISKQEQQIDSHEQSRSGGNQISETEGKPLAKSSREETAAQLAHAAAAHVNARQQVPPPPPVQQQQQQQYVYQQGGLPPQTQQIRGPPTNFSVQGNIHYPNDPYQQRNLYNTNYNQSNNNELFDNNEERRNRRSADKILDAFERFYMNKSTTAPMKVKYIPEENNSNHHHQQRNTNNNNNNNNNRDRSISQNSSSSSTWSNSDRLSTQDVNQKTACLYD